jgi:hypothetical protein
MSSYYNLAKLGRVKLPTNTEYALIDADGRAMIAPYYALASAYSEGDYVIMTGLTGTNAKYNDNLFRAKKDISSGTAFSVSDWEQVTIGSELGIIRESIKGGVHYRGKTSTPLYDGATTNPIVINGDSYTAEAGDLVIFDLFKISRNISYLQHIPYSVGTYISNGGQYYVTTDITAEENSSFDAISSKVKLVNPTNVVPYYNDHVEIPAHSYLNYAGIIVYVPNKITKTENAS